MNYEIQVITVPVTDVDRASAFYACRELTARGVSVSPIRHKSPADNWRGDWQPGPDHQRRDYASTASFADPDGNTWLLQEIGHRRPPGELP